MCVCTYGVNEDEDSNDAFSFIVRPAGFYISFERYMPSL